MRQSRTVNRLMAERQASGRGPLGAHRGPGPTLTGEARQGDDEVDRRRAGDMDRHFRGQRPDRHGDPAGRRGEESGGEDRAVVGASRAGRGRWLRIGRPAQGPTIAFGRGSRLARLGVRRAARARGFVRPLAAARAGGCRLGDRGSGCFARTDRSAGASSAGRQPGGQQRRGRGQQADETEPDTGAPGHTHTVLAGVPAGQGIPPGSSGTGRPTVPSAGRRDPAIYPPQSERPAEWAGPITLCRP